VIIIDNSVGHNLKVVIFPLIMRSMSIVRAIGELILRHSHLKISNEPDIIFKSIQEYMWITQPYMGYGGTSWFY
jgi:hypothetical protein